MDQTERPAARSTDQTDARQAVRLAVPPELPRIGQTASDALSKLTPPDLRADGYEWPVFNTAGDVIGTHHASEPLADWERAYLEAAATEEAEDPTILEDAEAACYGDRNTDYGHPREDFTRQAILWTGLLNHKLADGQFIDAEDIARCMVATKLARDVHSPKRDNRVDGAGYFLCLDRLETGK